MFGPRFEKYYPICFAFIAAVLLLPQMPWIFSRRALITTVISKLFAPALTVSAIAIGFLATSQSILISLKDSPGVKQMQTDGYHDSFVDFLSSATSLSFLLAIMSGILSALDFSKIDMLHDYLATIWIFFCVLTLLAYYRAVSLLPYILRGTIPRCAKKTQTPVPFNPDKK
jgi:hypothetical protein